MVLEGFDQEKYQLTKEETENYMKQFWQETDRYGV